MENTALQLQVLPFFLQTRTEEIIFYSPFVFLFSFVFPGTLAKAYIFICVYLMSDRAHSKKYNWLLRSAG